MWKNDGSARIRPLFGAQTKLAILPLLLLLYLPLACSISA